MVIHATTTRKKAKIRPRSPEPKLNELDSLVVRQRYTNLLWEGAPVVDIVAALFGRNKTAVHRWFRHGVPFHVLAYLELLEMVPREKAMEIIIRAYGKDPT